MLNVIVKQFGSDCLKSVMKSYCNYMSFFTKQSTVQQLIDMQLVHDLSKIENASDYEFSLLETKIDQDASKCTLEQIYSIRRRYCSELQLSETALHLTAVAESNPFTARWLVPSSLIFNIVKLTRAIKTHFFKEYKIISLTLDGMWLYMIEAEIELMWLHVSDPKIDYLFRTIHRQIVYELKIGNISVNKLSQYLMDQQPNLPEKASIQLSGL